MDVRKVLAAVAIAAVVALPGGAPRSRAAPDGAGTGTDGIRAQ